ncbi:olfactomedin-like protein 2B [Scleropages formosus]|uniref:olfactomedin-like protein 2B n=1 Tax=Scleropages formosus TaxID=113540 RepID=UPI000878117B|nr:olfactomedin-like protein 2B [Scleropages formosus]
MELLADYDKVKALSEGSDCRCKCVVRPLSRSACRRIAEGSAKAHDFYTVETVTSGSDCKCACIAPPSALNPCEGQFRLKKLQEAGKDDVKLSTIMDLLEGSFYGMDLLKLHSVTTKLLHRVENIEKAVSEKEMEQSVSVHEWAQEKERDSSELLTKKKPKGKSGYPVQGDVEASSTSKEQSKYEEKPSRTPPKTSQPDMRTRSRAAKSGLQGVVVRGMTYYKSEVEENGDMDERTTADEVLSGDGSVDLLTDNQIKKRHTFSQANEKLRKVASGDEGSLGALDHMADPTAQRHASTTVEKEKTERLPTMVTVPVAEEGLTKDTSGVMGLPLNTITGLENTTATTTTIAPATVASHATATLNTTARMAEPDVTIPPNATAQAVPAKPKYRISWTESPEDQNMAQELQNNSGICKDTLATISDPVTHNTYGQSEGAWMKDPKASDNKIYVTNYYYGNNLLEFKDLETFKQGQAANSYKLPYNWMGTGHVVYNKAFFYNRAFSRDIIKFDLRLRYVATWTVLHNAVYEEDTPWRWRGHSDIEFAVDEGGLWVIYPAMDDESFHQEVIILSKLNPSDLSIQKETSWRTALRRDYYGNCFVVCGVLYAVDSSNQMNANISYAFDTHTNTQMIPRLPFVNSYTYNTQVDYNPKERVLYSWDNGHQVTYNVIFAY